MPELTITPMTIKAAIVFVREHHRHSKAPVGGLFAVGVTEGGELVGVGIAGRPVARMLCDGHTVEIIRVCTLGALNCCSMLCGALCRAAKALGYKRVVTYTLGSELGSSLRASGFTMASSVRAESWHRESRPRLPGLVTERVRWERALAAWKPSEAGPLMHIRARAERPTSWPVMGMDTTENLAACAREDQLKADVLYLLDLLSERPVRTSLISRQGLDK